MTTNMIHCHCEYWENSHNWQYTKSYSSSNSHKIRTVNSFSDVSWDVLSLQFTSHVNYCNSILSSILKKVTDKFQQIHNAAASLVTVTQKYQHGLSQLIHDALHCRLFLSKRSTTLLWQSIIVFGTVLQGTSPTTVCQSPKFPVARICDLPDVINCQFHGSAAAGLEPMHFLLPDQQS